MGADEMTVAMAAAELGVSVPAIHSAIRRGRLDARRLGSIYVIARADLDAYRASVAHKGRPGPRPTGGKRRPATGVPTGG
jgi:excisionase family DNA binding protein